MEESLKSLRWSLTALAVACISIAAAWISSFGSAEPVTVMSIAVPGTFPHLVGYMLVLLLQSQVFLQIRHISRLTTESPEESGKVLRSSPMPSMYTGHGNNLFAIIVSPLLIGVQLIALPVFAGWVIPLFHALSAIGGSREMTYTITLIASTLYVLPLSILSMIEFRRLCSLAGES